MPHRYTDAQITTGIAEATAAYQAAPATSYLAARFGYTPKAMLRRLQRLHRAGLIAPGRRTGAGLTWRVT